MNQNLHPLDHKFRTLRVTEAITPYARVSPKISFRAILIRKFETQADSHYIGGISRRAIIVSFQRYSKILVVTNLKIFYFKHSPCSESCILSFGWFPGVWILFVDVSGTLCQFHLHRWCKLTLTECSKTSTHKTQTVANRRKERIQIERWSHRRAGREVATRWLLNIGYG